MKSENQTFWTTQKNKKKISSNCKSDKFSTGSKFVSFYNTVSTTEENGLLNFESYVVKFIYVLDFFILYLSQAVK